MKKYFLVLTFLFILPFVVNAAQVEDFYVDPGYDYYGRSQIEAVLKATGQHAYFFIEKDWWNSQSLTNKNRALNKLQTLSQEFSNTIYPKEREVFGEEWSPGIDQDERITVLFAKLISKAGGYFNPNDEYEKLQQTSNEREMVYLNADYLFDTRLPAFLAHEFQHLITHNQKVRLGGVQEEIWLNEARSEYAPTLCGYNTPYTSSNLEDRVEKFLNSPSDSLTEWIGTSNDYGPVNLFIHYLVDHYSEKFLTYMMESHKVGIASIEEALDKISSIESFSDAFTYWTIANLVNDCGIEPTNRFCYLNEDLTYKNLHITFGPPTVSTDSITSILTTKDWSANYHQLTMGEKDTTKDLKVEFQFSNENLFRVPYVLYSDDSPEIHYMNFEEDVGEFRVSNFGQDYSKVVIIPSSQKKFSGFDGRELSRQYRFSAALVEPIGFEIKPSETLLQAEGSPKVYITKGKYKRWIQTPEIFNSYPHLKWEDIEKVSREELDFYEESSLVRVAGQEKVYEINGDGTSHWLKMGAEQFFLSGRLPEMIFEINQREFDLYEPGSDVIV